MEGASAPPPAAPPHQVHPAAHELHQVCPLADGLDALGRDQRHGIVVRIRGAQSGRGANLIGARIHSRKDQPCRSSPGRRSACPPPRRRCPAAAGRCRCPPATIVLGTPLEPPFPEGLEQMPSSAWAASGAPRGCSGRPPGVYTTAVGYAGGLHAEPDLRGGVLRPHRPQRGRPGGVRPRQVITYEAIAEAVLGGPRPDPGHAPGQRRRHAVPLGHLRLLGRQQRGAAEASRDAYQERLTAAGYGEITTEIVAAPRVLLRRGLPPAVPGEGAQRLLRPRRHRRRLPDRGRRGRVTRGGPAVTARR